MNSEKEVKMVETAHSPWKRPFDCLSFYEHQISAKVLFIGSATKQQ